MRLAVAVVIIPSHFANAVTAAVLVAMALVATARGILPFRLGRQPELFISKLVQLLEKF